MLKIITTKPKAIIYCRVSSKEQEDTGYSLDSQEKLLKEYAERNGFRVEKDYRISESASGKQVRKSFMEMLQFATAHKITVILCEKIDRLTRNLKDAAVIDDWVKEDVKREVHFVKENFRLNSDTKAHDNFIWDMKVAVARFYANNLSEEVRKGQKEKLAQGWLPTKPPLGYKTIGEKGHKIHVIEEQTAPGVRQMFEWYATGNYSLARLESELYASGMRSRAGKRLCISRIHIMLQEPFYFGKILWKGELYQGVQEPLISKDAYDKVQVILKRKIQNPHFTKHTHLFKAKMYCEHCQGLVTWYEKKGHVYGHCNNHGQFSQCQKKTCIREDKVEQQLISYFEKLAPKNELVLGWIEEIIKEENSAHIKEREAEIQKLNGLLFQVRQRRDRYLEAKINGERLDFCIRKIEECDSEEEALQETLSKASEKSSDYQKLGIIIHELAYKAKQIFEKAFPGEKRLLLSELFLNLIQDETEIKPKFTPAAQYLMDWMPKLNKHYELTKNPTKNGVNGVLENQLSEPRLPEANVNYEPQKTLILRHDSTFSPQNHDDCSAARTRT